VTAAVVDGQWLAEHLHDVRLVDVRWQRGGVPGRQRYDAGHLPGAVFLDVDTDLSAPASPEAGRHPLPTPEHFAAALARNGIAEGTPVVAYDDVGGSMAARLWWMLHVLDEPVAVLDGGLDAWPGELVTAVPEVAPVERAPRPWPPRRFVDADEVARTRLPVYDARAAQRFLHADPELDPRSGHIPGARSAPWAANLNADGRLRPADELRALYADAADGRAIAYCGSGVTACLNLLAMHVAGIEDTALYVGSWSQWANDPTRPAETS
jgi:thiosulfate/3-mercaptopyruvate sulfurtransferase